jgi:hypothetical protein
VFRFLKDGYVAKVYHHSGMNLIGGHEGDPPVPTPLNLRGKLAYRFVLEANRRIGVSEEEAREIITSVLHLLTT